MEMVSLTILLRLVRSRSLDGMSWTSGAIGHPPGRRSDQIGRTVDQIGSLRSSAVAVSELREASNFGDSKERRQLLLGNVHLTTVDVFNNMAWPARVLQDDYTNTRFVTHTHIQV